MTVIRHPAPPPAPSERPYELIPVADLLGPQRAPEFLVEGLIEAKTNIGIVGAPETGKSLLAQHILASVATGSPILGRTVRRGLGVYLGGEGQHGYARRFQAIALHHNLDLTKAPLVIAKCATSLLDPQEVARVAAAIRAAEERFSLPLTLLVVDTLARFLAPGNENATPDMSAYMAAVDTLRGDATAISLHHPGHGDPTRGRGSSAWKGALDAEFAVTKASDVLTLETVKLKDGERPPPLAFRLLAAPTSSAREDGSPINSVVLVPCEVEPSTVRPALTGKAQQKLLAELERLAGPISPAWTEAELRAIARGLGLHKSSARDAVLGLRQHGYLEATVGGSRLVYFDDEGTKGRKRDERTFSSRGSRDETDGESVKTPRSSRPTYHPADPADGVAL